MLEKWYRGPVNCQGQQLSIPVAFRWALNRIGPGGSPGSATLQV